MTGAAGPVGMIGLGTMGGAIATRLVQAGLQIRVFDVDSDAVASLAEVGATPVASAAELTGCRLLLTSLPNDAIVEDVLVKQGLLDEVPGAILVELSTILPTTMLRIAERAEQVGVRVVDCPVSGGPNEALAGKLVLIVGAGAEVLDEARPALEPLGTVEPVGPVGAGKALKLVNNVMSMCNVAVAAEAFTLGTSFGLDPQRLYEVLSTSGGRSGQFVKRIPYVLERDFHARFAITLAEKDLRLAIEMAHELTTAMPVAAGVHQLYEQAIGQGMGGEDQMAVIKLYEQWSSAVGPHGKTRAS